jgi:dinuclear metal center YbgI/SA1388 family protein
MPSQKQKNASKSKNYEHLTPMHRTFARSFSKNGRNLDSGLRSKKQAMQISAIIDLLEGIAPPYLQESYDNSGLLVGRRTDEVRGVIFCLDSTEAVVAEAVQRGCNLVVAHHPIVFRGLKRFNEANYVERTIAAAIRNDVAIYAIHTNLDNVYHQGVNAKMAEKLNLRNTQILQPKLGQTDAGAGLLGILPDPIPELAFLDLLKRAFGCPMLRHTQLRGKPVSKVALCGGSGSFLLPEALRVGADAFVTADFKYHEFFDAEGRLVVCDIGHFESEQYTIELLFDIVREKFPTFALHCTKTHTNPVFYY